MKQSAPSKTITYQKVRRDIEKWVKLHSDFYSLNENWYCGITNNPRIRESQHRNRTQSKLYYFKAWYASSFHIARALEISMHKKGMKDRDSVGNAKSNSWYVYVFKADTNILDDIFG